VNVIVDLNKRTLGLMATPDNSLLKGSLVQKFLCKCENFKLTVEIFSTLSLKFL
jgi:hypothetical protein